MIQHLGGALLEGWEFVAIVRRERRRDFLDLSQLKTLSQLQQKIWSSRFSKRSPADASWLVMDPGDDNSFVQLAQTVQQQRGRVRDCGTSTLRSIDEISLLQTPWRPLRAAPSLTFAEPAATCARAGLSPNGRTHLRARFRRSLLGRKQSLQVEVWHEPANRKRVADPHMARNVRISEDRIELRSAHFDAIGVDEHFHVRKTASGNSARARANHP